MNRLMTRLLAFAAVLTLSTACDEGTTEPGTPTADAGAPGDAGPDPVIPDVSLGLSADARACEVMFLDPEGQLGAVVFGAALEGRSLRRGDRLAIAFAHRADAPIPPGAVALVAQADAAGVQIESGACFDKSGAAIADPGITLDAL